MKLSLEVKQTGSLLAAEAAEVRALCCEAYQENLSGLLADLGPGVHVLGRAEGALVTHAMWIPRPLRAGARPPLLSAYVEAVATRPAFQRRGLASAVMRRLAHEIGSHDLGALCPSDESFYARLGWERWRGPLFVERTGLLEPTPEETVMVLRLPRTPPDLDLDAPLSAQWRPGEVW
jgi:aminoglycoside 2'-N-acetyltransferase I